MKKWSLVFIADLRQPDRSPPYAGVFLGYSRLLLQLAVQNILSAADPGLGRQP